MFAGWLGNDALAAYQDAINVNAFVFMAGPGIADGDLRARGQRRRPATTRSACASPLGRAGLNIALLASVGVVIWFNRGAIAAVFTSNPAVHASLVDRARPRLHHQHLRRAAGRC